MVAYISRIVELKHFRFVIKIPETVLCFTVDLTTQHMHWYLTPIEIYVQLILECICSTHLHVLAVSPISSEFLNIHFEFSLMNWIDEHKLNLFQVGRSINSRSLATILSRKQLITENWNRYVWVISASAFVKNHMNNAPNTFSYIAKCFPRKTPIFTISIAFFQENLERCCYVRCYYVRCRWEC